MPTRTTSLGETGFLDWKVLTHRTTVGKYPRFQPVSAKDDLDDTTVFKQDKQDVTAKRAVYRFLRPRHLGILS
jgi:hypothetical protein